MSQPWVHRDIDGGPCTHALVLGVSAYRHLPQEPDLADPRTLGLSQAKTPASSALRFARWLRDDYHNPAAPLGTIRLLLSPSPEEAEGDPDLVGLAQRLALPDRNGVEAALGAWRQDCLTNRGHTAILYAAGHGVQTSKEGSLLLLEDFARPGDANLLNRVLDVGGVRAGMSRDDIAQNQFFFVDSCRIRPDLFSRFLSFAGGLSLDNLVGGAARVSAVFFGASAGTAALGDPGKGTLFCQALLDCVQLEAVTASEGYGLPWAVTTASLLKELPRRVQELARSYDAEQRASVGGELVDVIFHVPRNPPRVPLKLRVRPDAAAQFSRARLYDGEREEEIFSDERFITPELVREVPAGLYVLSITIDPGSPFRDRTAIAVPAVPPRPIKEVDVG